MVVQKLILSLNFSTKPAKTTWSGFFSSFWESISNLKVEQKKRETLREETDMSRMFKTFVLFVITVMITEITCEEIHFKSCPIGDVNKKLKFSKATCDDCLQKSKGRVGSKCRFTGPPLLVPPSGVSPRAHTKKFVDLVNKMMKESSRGLGFTYAELKRRLQDENIPLLNDRTLEHWTKEPYVLPKISKDYINQRGPFLDPYVFFNPPLDL